MTLPSLDYYRVEELLSDEERAARDRARRFVEEEVMPVVVPHHRAGTFPEDEHTYEMPDEELERFSRGAAKTTR